MGRTNISSGGMKINGIIEEYIVGNVDNINAGDFVNYVNEQRFTQESIKLNETQNVCISVSAIKLTENKVFIIHSTSNYYRLYGMVITINNNTVIVENDVLFKTNSNSSYSSYYSAIKLDKNRVFIAYRKPTTSSDAYLYGMIVEINDDNTIEVVADMILSENQENERSLSSVKLTENKVFIAHETGSYNFNGMIITINNNIINVESDTKISILYTLNIKLSAIKLAENKVFIAYGGGKKNNLLGMIVTINEDTLTIEYNTGLNSADYSGQYISIMKLDDNKVLITHSYKNDNKYLYGMLVAISDSKIAILGVDTKLKENPTDHTYSLEMSLVKLGENSIFIAYSYDWSRLYTMVVEINNDNTITVSLDIGGTGSSNTGYALSAIKLAENKVFIAYKSSDEYLYGVIVNNIFSIKKVKDKTENFFGIAKTKGTEGKTVQVYVPNI